jgi:four helix bundle protein
VQKNDLSTDENLKLSVLLLKSIPMAKRHNYKNLSIWKLGLEIAFNVSDIIKKFPEIERFALSDQMNRCSISIPSNIAEGSARSQKSFKYYVNIAMGSSFELVTQLIIAKHRAYITEAEFEVIEAKIEHFQRMASGFQNQL